MHRKPLACFGLCVGMVPKAYQHNCTRQTIVLLQLTLIDHVIMQFGLKDTDNLYNGPTLEYKASLLQKPKKQESLLMSH
jgi:hypothetical protein